MNNISPTYPLEFAIQIATEAGKILMKNYGLMQKLEWNKKTHFKTEVDDLSDKLIRMKIGKIFPQDNIYSEESDALEQKAKFSWIIDPLDGTIPYRYGITDHFSVCVGRTRGKTPVLGVINAPKRREIYVAEIGKGAFCNHETIKVLDEENLNKVIMGLDGGKETEYFKRASLAPYIARVYSPNGITCFTASGCASVPLCLVASGKLHAYVALSLEPWDMAATVPIIREAGGKVTTITGKEWELGDESILATNPKLHTKLLTLLNE